MASEIDKTALYYINQKIDTLEANLQRQLDERFDSLEKKIDTHLSLCGNTRSTFNIRVSRLESFKNKAVGAVALFLFLIGIWQAVQR